MINRLFLEQKDTYLGAGPNSYFMHACRQCIDPKEFTNKRALDLGCGTGANLVYLQKKFKMKPEGCDINPDNFKEYNKQFKLGIIESDIRRYPIVGKYDVIVCFNVLMWLNEIEQTEVLNTINEHLSKNGLFILSIMTNWHNGPRNVVGDNAIEKIFGKPILVEKYDNQGPIDKKFQMMVYKKRGI